MKYGQHERKTYYLSKIYYLQNLHAKTVTF